MKFVKRALALVAISTLPLLQGCVGGAEDEVVRTAWMPFGSVLSFAGSGGTGGTQGNTGSSGSGGSGGVSVPGGAGGGNQVSGGGTAF